MTSSVFSWFPIHEPRAHFSFLHGSLCPEPFLISSFGCPTFAFGASPPSWRLSVDQDSLFCRWQTPLCSLLTCLSLNILFLTLNEGKNCFQGRWVFVGVWWKNTEMRLCLQGPFFLLWVSFSLYLLGVRTQTLEG